MIEEIELLLKELSSSLSQLSQLMNLSNAVYSLYSTFNSTATAETDLLRPSIFKRVYLIYEPPDLESVLQTIGRDLGEKWWIPWERRGQVSTLHINRDDLLTGFVRTEAMMEQVLSPRSESGLQIKKRIRSDTNGE